MTLCRLFAGLILTSTALVAQGCGRTRDCSKLADITNRRGAEIAQLGARQSNTPETLATDMRALSEVADRVVDEVQALEIDDDALEAHAQAFYETAQDLSEASQSYAALMETVAKQRSAQSDAASDFEQSGQALLDACATASAACNAVGDVLREQPENPEVSRLAGLLEAYVEGLEALDLEEGPVAKAVGVRIAAAKTYEALISRRLTLDEDVERARDRIHETVDKQNALLEQLNVFCVGKE